MPTYNECNRTAEKLRAKAAGMLEMADFIEKRGVKLPDLPWVTSNQDFTLYLNVNDYAQNEDGTQDWSNPVMDEEKTAKNIKEFVAACGKVEKEFGDNDLKVKKTFGAVSLTGTVNRTLVCTKKVVAKEWVEPYTVDGHFKEKVEWDCVNPSILAL